MQTPARIPAPIPLADTPTELRALYARVHWLVIADMDRALADNEKALAEATEDTLSWVLATIRGCIPLLRQRREDYLREYTYNMGRTDVLSLETMRRFVERARELHGEKPEFSFLFEAEGRA